MLGECVILEGKVPQEVLDSRMNGRRLESSHQTIQDLYYDSNLSVHIQYLSCKLVCLCYGQMGEPAIYHDINETHAPEIVGILVG
jgi:hypothetical protein